MKLVENRFVINNAEMKHDNYYFYAQTQSSKMLFRCLNTSHLSRTLLQRKRLACVNMCQWIDNGSSDKQLSMVISNEIEN